MNAATPHVLIGVLASNQRAKERRTIGAHAMRAERLFAWATGQWPARREVRMLAGIFMMGLALRVGYTLFADGYMVVLHIALHGIVRHRYPLIPLLTLLAAFTLTHAGRVINGTQRHD